MKLISVLTLFLFLMSFNYSQNIEFEIKGQSENKRYGYSKKEPIRVGGGSSAGYHFLFIQHLRGPNGEKLEVKRIGSCGNYNNPDPLLTKFDKGILTCFSINCNAFKKPRVLYFDKYRNGDLFIPLDLKWKN